MATADFTNNVKHNLRAKRYRLHTLYMKKVALAQAVNLDNKHPFAVFDVDTNGELRNAQYCENYTTAARIFENRSH